MTTSKEKITERNEILHNLLNSIEGKDYESICLALCFTLASHLHYFVKKDKTEEFLDNFKSATLKALDEIEEEREDGKNTVH